MLSAYDQGARPYRTVTITALLVLLFLALVVNSVVAALAVRDYYPVNRWLADPAPTPNSEIVVLKRELPRRVVSRLVVSAVLLLSAAFFI